MALKYSPSKQDSLYFDAYRFYEKLSSVDKEYIAWVRLTNPLDKIKKGLHFLEYGFTEKDDLNKDEILTKVKFDLLSEFFETKHNLLEVVYTSYWKSFCELVSWTVNYNIGRFKRKWKRSSRDINTPWYVLAALTEPDLLHHEDLIIENGIFKGALLSSTLFQTHNIGQCMDTYFALDPTVIKAIVMSDKTCSLVLQNLPDQIMELSIMFDFVFPAELIAHLINLECYCGPINQEILDVLSSFPHFSTLSVSTFDSEQKLEILRNSPIEMYI